MSEPYQESPSFRAPNHPNSEETHSNSTENILLQVLTQNIPPLTNEQIRAGLIQQNLKVPGDNSNHIVGNLSVKTASNLISLDNSKDITVNSLKREFNNITANSSIPNIDEDEDLDMIEEVSRTIRKCLFCVF